VPITLVLPRHFSLKCLYQARKVSGQALEVRGYGFDHCFYDLFYLILELFGQCGMFWLYNFKSELLNSTNFLIN
jgi:hypothetical protein